MIIHLITLFLTLLQAHAVDYSRTNCLWLAEAKNPLLSRFDSSVVDRVDDHSLRQAPQIIPSSCGDQVKHCIGFVFCDGGPNPDIPPFVNEVACKTRGGKCPTAIECIQDKAYSFVPPAEQIIEGPRKFNNTNRRAPVKANQ